MSLTLAGFSGLLAFFATCIGKAFGILDGCVVYQAIVGPVSVLDLLVAFSALYLLYDFLVSLDVVGESDDPGPVERRLDELNR